MCIYNLPTCRPNGRNYQRICDNDRCTNFHQELLDSCAKVRIDAFNYSIPKRDKFCEGGMDCINAPGEPNDCIIGICIC